jgi:hypothetical protein
MKDEMVYIKNPTRLCLLIHLCKTTFGRETLRWSATADAVVRATGSAASDFAHGWFFSHGRCIAEEGALLGGLFQTPLPLRIVKGAATS